MPSEPAFDGERLHPSSLVFAVAGQARALLLPALFAIFVAEGVWTALILVVFFFPAAIRSIVHYYSFRYRFGEGELVLREGILTKKSRSIPFSRIQNVDQRRNVFHRMLGVSSVKIETASGGSEAEAELDVLAVEAVERMRARVFAGRRREARTGATRDEANAALDATGTAPAGPPSGPAGEPFGVSDREAPAGVDRDGERIVHRLTLDDLVAYGLTSGRGMALVAAALGAAWQFDVFERIDLGARLRALLGADFSAATASASLLAIAMLVAAGLIGVTGLSVVWAILRYHGFRLARAGDDLRARHGLFTTFSTTTPRYRIQYLRVRETLLHRLVGRLAIRVETAGGDRQDGATGREWLVPLARREELPGLLDEIQPEVSFDDVEWRRVDSRALRRLFRKGLVLAILATGAAVLAFGVPGLVVLAPTAALAWVAARVRVRVLGYALGRTALLIRDGFWTRTRTAVRYSKVQTVILHRNPFDRRYGMGVLVVDTAGAAGSTDRVRLPFLALSDARRLMELIRRRAAATEFRW